MILPLNNNNPKIQSMFKKLYAIMAALVLVSCAGQSGFDAASVADATPVQIDKVEPLSWWTGMKLPLQIMVKGENISQYSARIEGGRGVEVVAAHPGESANYQFLDVRIDKNAQPGTYYLVFTKGEESFKVPYEIAARVEGSAERKSFTTADMIYLIMPDRFSNGDPSNDNSDLTSEKADRNAFFGRHGGDIQGLINHLDYIHDLGATAIWCTPLLEDNQPEESYHGYACTDYYHIDSRFGSNELYREYAEKAHEKDLKVIMDIVTNHCGTAHWWMEDLPFADWIHQFPEFTPSNVCFSTNMDINASKQDLYIQESGWFVPTMADMNLDNPYVLQYFKQWAIWWIEYAGLDGFRVDTYPYNEREPMSQWCEAIINEYPNFNIVGECWTTMVPQLAYWQADNPNKDGFNSHLPSIMDFPLHDAIRMGLNEPAVWGQGMVRIYDALSNDFAYQDLSHMMTFVGNHDTDRIADVLGKDPDKVKLAMTMLATLRGIPQMFAGDEQMQVSKRRSEGHGGLRCDFPGGWAGDSIDAFTAEGRAAMTCNTDGEAVAKGQIEDVYNYVSRLFNWRKGKKVIHDGSTMHFLSRDNTYGYFRYDNEEVVFVFINNADETKNIPWDNYAELTSDLHQGRNVLTGESVEVSSKTVVAPHKALVVEFNR